ncbi:hypothetical protein KC19_3G175800 [Ceratodon purpureus]|nr:hypothetical protein KC19_3G175800 [Ceratodon purpureus]
MVLPAVGIACLGAILFGYHLGVVNSALDYISRDLGFATNTVKQGWVVSSTLAGATVGSFTGGALADKLGRKRTFQLNALPLIVGTLLSAKASNFEAMVLGRILVGVGIGVSSGVVPLYISEVSPTEIRGTMGTLNQLFICVGILLALIAGLPLGGNPAWWRNMFGIATVPAVLLALGMAYCPESPRWLYKQGRTSEAEVAVRKLWGKAKVESSMADLKAGSVEAVKGDNQDAGWGELFGKRYRKVVTVGMAMFLFQQFAGINAVVYFSTQVFRSAGITSDVAASALVGAANVIGTTVASSMMDKSGRRTLLMGSYTGMSLSMLLLSLALSWSALAPYSGTLAVLGTVAYVLAFSLGAGPVPALLLPEIFGARIRAKAVSLSLGVHWICNFMIGLMFLSVVQRFGVSTVYLFFAVVCAAAVVYVNGNVVETKGRSLEDIERELCPAV